MAIRRPLIVYSSGFPAEMLVGDLLPTDVLPPITAAGGTTGRTLQDHLGTILLVLNCAAAGTQVDRTGQVDASVAFAAAYAAAVTGQAISVPPGKYLLTTPPAILGGKVVSWHCHNATDPAGADLVSLQATGHILMTANRGGTITIAGQGAPLGYMDQLGGDAGTRLDVVSTGNAIVGYSVQIQAGSTAFPTGVTGFGDVRAAGTQAFGIYGQANLYTSGVATNELDAFNYAGAPSSLLPPNRGAGTTENNAITLTIGGGSGPYAASIGIDIERSGSGMLTGLYVAPDAVTSNGILLDATATAGPLHPMIVKGRAGVVSQVIAVGAYAAATPLQTWSSANGLSATLYQDGTFQNANARIGGDGSILGTQASLASIQFSATTAAKINLYSTIFGIGVAAGELTLFSNGIFAFRSGSFTGPVVATIDNAGNAAFASVAVSGNPVLTQAAAALAYQPIGSALQAVRVITAAGAVQLLAADAVIVIRKTAGAPTAVMLEASPALGATHVIKDGRGDAGINSITVTPASGTIDGAASFVIGVAYAAVSLVFNGMEWSAI